MALNNMQLDVLAEQDEYLEPFFYGTVPCDGLPLNPEKLEKTAYIVNTDPSGRPGQHWIALWTENNTCEMIGSYGLPLTVYRQAEPLRKWLKEHWSNFKKKLSNPTSLKE